MNKLFRKVFKYASKSGTLDFKKTRSLLSITKTDNSKFLINTLKLSASAFLFSSIYYHHQTQCMGGAEGSTENPEANDLLNNTLPVEHAILAHAPNVPPPITRRHHALVKADLEFTTQRGNVTRSTKYDFWAINGSVPAPFIRCRVGDVLELTVRNNDESGMPHNLDIHSVAGPGGGSALTTVQHGQSKTARFKLKYPGLFFYHCAAAPIPLHIANGMYGLILVEPEGGLPQVDREYYVMQSEFYFDPPQPGEPVATMAYDKGLMEQPDAIVFNGREGSLTDKTPLKAHTGETLRIFFGNAGPNKIANFHIIGEVMERVYREGDLLSPPARNIQTTMVPPGGAAVLEFKPLVPGNYAFIDHAIFRLDKGAVGFLNVIGPKRPDLYSSAEEPEQCFNCKVHP